MEGDETSDVKRGIEILDDMTPAEREQAATAAAAAEDVFTRLGSMSAEDLKEAGHFDPVENPFSVPAEKVPQPESQDPLETHRGESEQLHDSPEDHEHNMRLYHANEAEQKTFEDNAKKVKTIKGLQAAIAERKAQIEALKPGGKETINEQQSVKTDVIVLERRLEELRAANKARWEARKATLPDRAEQTVGNVPSEASSTEPRLGPVIEDLPPHRGPGTRKRLNKIIDATNRESVQRSAVSEHEDQKTAEFKGAWQESAERAFEFAAAKITDQNTLREEIAKRKMTIDRSPGALGSEDLRLHVNILESRLEELQAQDTPRSKLEALRAEPATPWNERKIAQLSGEEIERAPFGPKTLNPEAFPVDDPRHPETVLKTRDHVSQIPPRHTAYDSYAAQKTREAEEAFQKRYRKDRRLLTKNRKGLAEAKEAMQILETRRAKGDDIEAKKILQEIHDLEQNIRILEAGEVRYGTPESDRLWSIAEQERKKREALSPTKEISVTQATKPSLWKRLNTKVNMKGLLKTVWKNIGHGIWS